MNLTDWRFCSQEDDAISLHDCAMDHMKCDKDGLWLMFEDGFDVTKDNSLNPTGRHQLTGKAAVFLKEGSYLEGDWNRNCTQQGPNDSDPIPMQEVPILWEQLVDLSPEVLDFTWDPDKQYLSITAIDNVGYCDINFACVEVWFCWNELTEDAWFQDWPKE